MAYITNNEFEHFDFGETHIKDIELGSDYLHIWLDNVKILSENTCNRDIRTMRTNGLLMKIPDMQITSFVREGYKIYNADGKPMGTKEDEVITEKEYMDILPEFLEGMVYSITKEKKENRAEYTFIVDAADESTYDLVVEGMDETEEWNRFMNLDSM